MNSMLFEIKADFDNVAPIFLLVSTEFALLKKMKVKVDCKNGHVCCYHSWGNRAAK